jgi:hypothetical protein
MIKRLKNRIKFVVSNCFNKISRNIYNVFLISYYKLMLCNISNLFYTFYQYSIEQYSSQLDRYLNFIPDIS